MVRYPEYFLITREPANPVLKHLERFTVGKLWKFLSQKVGRAAHTHQTASAYIIQIVKIYLTVPLAAVIFKAFQMYASLKTVLYRAYFVQHTFSVYIYKEPIPSSRIGSVKYIFIF